MLTIIHHPDTYPQQSFNFHAQPRLFKCLTYGCLVWQLIGIHTPCWQQVASPGDSTNIAHEQYASFVGDDGCGTDAERAPGSGGMVCENIGLGHEGMLL